MPTTGRLGVRRTPFVNQHGEARFVIRSGAMLGPFHLLPDVGIDGRKLRIAAWLQVHARDHQPIGAGDGLGVVLGATSTPGALKAWSRLTTMLVRPASGRPMDR